MPRPIGFPRRSRCKTNLQGRLNIVALAWLYRFIIWLPTFFVKQGLSMTASLEHPALVSGGSLIGVVLAGIATDK